MSGIVGILNLDGTPVELSQLEQMTSFLTFRGPDAQDTWLDGNVGFGHALLRTTYESETEQQPCTLDRQVWITADARVDGRADLIMDLRGRGRAVDGTTNDVELILHAYAMWETRCVEHLIGDFAFAIWDARTRQLLCVRDQFGVVPFYYAQVGHSFLFSNTLDCLRLDPRVSNHLNEQALGDFLLFRGNQDLTTTTFSDIRRLPPAHILTINDGVLHTARYWSLPNPGAIHFRPADEIVAQFQTLFEQAVGDRLRTNCVAVPMSGGLDSSSIAVTAQRLLKADDPGPDTTAERKRGVRAYTVTVDHLIEDEERYYAGLTAAHADIPIQYLRALSGKVMELDNTTHVRPSLEH